MNSVLYGIQSIAWPLEVCVSTTGLFVCRDCQIKLAMVCRVS
jgi:hypothetical protein